MRILLSNGTPIVAGTNGNSAAGNVTVSNQQNSSTKFSITLPRVGSTVEGILKADVDGKGTVNTNVLSSGTIQLVLIKTNFYPIVYTTVNNGLYSFSNLPEGVTYTLQTIDVTGTEPSTSTNLSFKYNLNFTAAPASITPLVGNKAYLDIITLN